MSISSSAIGGGPTKAKPGNLPAVDKDQCEKTLDLRALAMLGKNERVEVAPIPDKTLEAFNSTLLIIGTDSGQEPPVQRDKHRMFRKLEFSPRDGELRKIFMFAEILGGYDAVNELMRKDSPQHRLSLKFGETVMHRELLPTELAKLEEYHRGLKTAIENAKEHYQNTGLKILSKEEKKELYGMVLSARDKTREITEILGKNLIFQIEHAVVRLKEIRQQVLGVERTISGVFLVDGEVMFIPSEELMAIVSNIFKGVGNPYLAGNIDGVLLLAARNLLIEVVSFYSYYGKHQIYQLFKKGRAVDRQRVTLRIRNEIRKLLNACKEDNKLVLTRVMAKEERQLDLSIETILREAEKEAVEAVIKYLPQQESLPPPVGGKGFFKRLFGWLGF